MTKPTTPTPTYDRFGWYWQPESWLTNMSAHDVTQATTSATHIYKQETALKTQTEHQIHTFNQRKNKQLEIIKQLEN